MTVKMPPLDRAAAWAVGKALVWLGKRAYDRGDTHGYEHALAALRAGDSTTCGHGVTPPGAAS